jgi:hypothetical protein
MTKSQSDFTVVEKTDEIENCDAHSVVFNDRAGFLKIKRQDDDKYFLILETKKNI